MLDVGRREGAERLLVVAAEVDVAEIIGIDGIKPIAVFLKLLGMAFQHIVHAFREVRSVGTLLRDTAKLLIDDTAHILPFCRVGIKRNQERRLSRRESADRRAGGNTVAGALGLADGLGINQIKHLAEERGGQQVLQRVVHIGGIELEDRSLRCLHGADERNLVRTLAVGGESLGAACFLPSTAGERGQILADKRFDAIDIKIPDKGECEVGNVAEAVAVHLLNTRIANLPEIFGTEGQGTRMVAIDGTRDAVAESLGGVEPRVFQVGLHAGLERLVSLGISTRAGNGKVHQLEEGTDVVGRSITVQALVVQTHRSRTGDLLPSQFLAQIDGGELTQTTEADDGVEDLQILCIIISKERAAAGTGGGHQDFVFLQVCMFQDDPGAVA